MGSIWLRPVLTAALGILGGLGVLFSETPAAGWAGTWPVVLAFVETGLICRWGRRPAWPGAVWGGLLVWNILATYGGVAAVTVWLAFRAGLRSGCAFPSRPLAAVGREVLITGGGLLPLILVDGTPRAWALGVGLFFLVQALYYVLFTPPAPPTPQEACERDRRRVARLLARQGDAFRAPGGPRAGC